MCTEPRTANNARSWAAVAGPFRRLENAVARLDGCQDFGNTESYVDYFLETR
jgi:hypothetical protein